MDGSAVVVGRPDLRADTRELPELRLLEIRLEETNARLESSRLQGLATQLLAGLLAVALVGFALFTAYAMASLNGEAARDRLDLEREIGQLRTQLEGGLTAVREDLEDHSEDIAEAVQDLDQLEGRILLMQAEVERPGPQ